MLSKRLRAVHNDQAKPTVYSEPMMSNQPARVLIVDDNEYILHSLKGILELSGYAVDTAEDGVEALHKVSDSYFDIVVSDIEMPNIDGLEFLRRLKNTLNTSIPVILMTGYLNPNYAIEAIRLGAIDFIIKPLDANQILRSIHAQVKKKSAPEHIELFRNFLNKVEIEFLIRPYEILNQNLSVTLGEFFISHFRTNSSFYNVIMLCVEEMINNAFIHGTLNLTQEIRNLGHQAYFQYIEAELTKQEIRDKRIILKVLVDRSQQQVQISVTDEGKGFDYDAWLKRLNNQKQFNLDVSGRGIELLGILCDSVQFDNGGRTISITKRFDVSHH